MVGSEPRITVVVPFRNEGEHIQACIHGLLSQDYPAGRYQVILVDNNSTDRSRRLVRDFPRIRLLTETRPGSYAARNRACRESDGEILAFTDADCLAAATWLSELARKMCTPGIELVLGRVRYPPSSALLQMLECYLSLKASHVFSSRDPSLYYGYTNNLAVRRGALDQVGPFLEVDRGADTVLVQRVARTFSAGAVAYAPLAIVEHREIRRLSDYLCKQFIYGCSNRRNRRWAWCRPLPRARKMELFQTAVLRQGLSAGRSLILLLILGMGVLLHTLGSGAARFLGLGPGRKCRRGRRELVSDAAGKGRAAGTERCG